MVLSNANLHVYLNAHKTGNISNTSDTDKNNSTGTTSDQGKSSNNDQPHGISTTTFFAVFCLGFLAVIIFYGWKKGKKIRIPKTYKYSVLNQFDAEPDDDILDFGQTPNVRSEGVQDSDEEDVTFDRRMLDEDSSIFLGQPISGINSADIVYDNTALQAHTVTVPTQLNLNGRTSSAILDSDEELLK